MQKANRLLLAAVALLGTSAVFAQSSVTLYGRVNTSVERQKTGDTSVTRMVNNSSRIGFRGVEDLGGGLKAGFVLESGFNSDDGAGSGWTHGDNKGGMTFARQSEVNLSGGFGMLRLGNFTPESYYASADYVSMHNHDTGTSSDAFYQDPVWFGRFNAPRGETALSTKNKLGYRTPSFGGFTVDAAVSMHEREATLAAAKYGYDLAANYNIGAVQLGAGYSRVDSNWQASLRGLYTLGQFTIGGYYQRNDEERAGTRNNYRLAAMYAIGASEIHANVGRAAKWSNIPDSAATQWTLGYNYNLSKRTKAYAFYTKVDNKAGASYMSGVAGDNFSSFAVGVRHNF
ncbi:porin [Melaminivora sp.]|uniref:porin n=1 Tax=Melaminivora sp. TaxID=1933032 RepID=UPI0028AE1F58|nr:porin [Melaminivora sp.]